ncbi:MAG: PAS domain S-box protein, partial [Deltaproteobacteria bacterium]
MAALTDRRATAASTPEAYVGRHHRVSRALSYVVAVLAALAALVARYELNPIWGSTFPFITFYPAVALAAWLGGLGPGLLATAIATVGALLFLFPLGALRLDHASLLIGVGLFTSVNVFVAALTEALHRALGRAATTLDAVRQSEERLRSVVTSATDAIITIDADQRITLFNAAAEAIFGYAAAEMTGRTLDQLLPERFREVHRRHVVAFGAATVSMRMMGGERVLAGLRRNGDEFPIEARISQGEAGGQPLYTVILRDITQRKRAERDREELLAITQRARSEAERMQSLTEAALADLPFEELLQELTRRVQTALESAAAVIFLEEDGVLYARAAVGLEEEVRERAQVPVGTGFAGRIAQERRPIVLDEVDYGTLVNGYIRAKGIRSLAGVPLMSGERRVLGVLHVGSTQPRKFGDEDVRLLQLAAERVALAVERAARIEAERRARAEAEAANRAKDEFLAMLGHELRNPLAAVQNAVAAARLDESGRHRALEIASRQTEQLARLIDDLLDVARIRQGRITLRKERVHLAETIERAVEATRPFVEQRRHTLSIALPPNDVRLEADPVRLEQIVVNLLSNAVKYTEPGGRISVSVERQGDEGVIRVCDSGIGIAPDMLPHVFELFTQSPRALDRAEGGLGIGLTIVRRLVELHGGRIEARSEGIRKGAEFVVWLPARPAMPEEAAEAPRVDVGRQSHARVLVVEDNVDAAEGLTMLLELLGHHVRVVHDGGAALEAAQANTPDVMLIDIGLPGMDGYEVAHR